MKKHIMSGHGKKYLHVGDNGELLDTEYELRDIKTYCGKEYATVQEAIANNVFKSVTKDDPEVCKTCSRWQRAYADQRALRQAAANKRVW